MSFIQLTIDQPVQGPVNIKVPAGSDIGTSGTYSIFFTVTDATFQAGDPDITLVLSLTIREAAQYTFSNGSASKSRSAVMSKGKLSSFFRFSIKNVQPLPDKPDNPLPFNLICSAYDKSSGPGQQASDIDFVAVTKN